MQCNRYLLGYLNLLLMSMAGEAYASVREVKCEEKDPQHQQQVLAKGA